MSVLLYNDNCLDFLSKNNIPKNSIIVTDPTFNLSLIHI